jgi:hypothetical protein
MSGDTTCIPQAGGNNEWRPDLFNPLIGFQESPHEVAVVVEEQGAGLVAYHVQVREAPIHHRAQGLLPVPVGMNPAFESALYREIHASVSPPQCSDHGLSPSKHVRPAPESAWRCK